jgi:MFS transporter, DHA3 family, macrolide efflux protein
MREGLRYVVAWRGLFILILGASLINFLFNPAFTLLPILVTKVFGGGALQLGWVNSAWGFGVVAGGLTLSVWGGFKKRILTTIMGVLGMGVGTLIMGLSPAPLFVLALVGMLLVGFMNPIANGPLMAIFQANVAPQMQGRVISLISMVAGAMSPLSLLIAGPVADLLGVRVWYMVAGVGAIAIAMVMLTMPAIMNMEQERSKHALDQSTTSALVPALDAEQAAI